MVEQVRIGILLATSAILLTLGTAAGGGMSRLASHVPLQQIARSADLGRLDGSTRVPLTIALKLRDPDGLNNLVKRIYDPADPLYHHFYRPNELADAFAPSEEEVTKVANYLTARGLNVVRAHPNRLFITVEGAAADVENAFQLELHQYLTPDGRIGYAPTLDPLVSDEIAPAIQSIQGLHTLSVARSNLRRPASQVSVSRGHTVARSSDLTGPGEGAGQMAPNDIRTAYNLPVLSSGTTDGTGQSFALVEFDGYNPSDISEYVTSYSTQLENITPTTAPSVTPVPVPSGSPIYPSPGGTGAAEVTLDIDMLIALAPMASNIYVYEGPNSLPGALETYSQIQSDDKASIVSTSWGYAEDGLTASFVTSENWVFAEMVAEGMTVFAASGDYGAFGNPDYSGRLVVQDPSSQPDVVAVGGTTLTITTPGSNWQTESSWGDSSDGEGGGGGVSIWESQPSYQEGLASATNHGSATMRMVPDVSLNANPDTGYAFYYTGPLETGGNGSGWAVVGGTSAAAPLWAAFYGLVNQARLNASYPVLGFLNPTLYQVAESNVYATTFHDIADNSTNLFYTATSGYDLSTGWGSFNGTHGVGDNGLYNILTAQNLPPAHPSSLTATASGNTVTLTWGTNDWWNTVAPSPVPSGAPSPMPIPSYDPVANDTPLTYAVYRSTSPTGPFTLLSSTGFPTGPQGTSYIDVGLTSGVTYYYYVNATDASGDLTSGNSLTVSAATALTPPAAPTGLTVTVVQQ